jgi:hypothetical protein
MATFTETITFITDHRPATAPQHFVGTDCTAIIVDEQYRPMEQIQTS